MAAATHVLEMSPLTVQDGPSDWQAFFGQPKGPIVTDPYRYRSTQNFDLPDAFKGKSQYLGEIIDQQVLTGDTFYTQVLLPIKRTDHMSETWNRWEFDQHYLDVVPEEGVSRLIESRTEEESRAIVRRGIAMQLEHGFMNTERGRMQYLLNLRQIALAVQETNNFDVLSAILQADNYNMTWQRNHGYYNRMRIEQRIELEIDQWACIQKDTFGFEKLNARIDDMLEKYKARADTWVLPPQLENFEKFKPHNTDFYLSGKTWSVDSVNTVRMVGRNKVYMMRSYNVSKAEPIDISTRERQIGSFNTMFDRLRDIRKGDEYTSSERIVKRYDENKDDWVALTLDVALDNAHIFNDDGTLASVITSESHVPNFKKDIKHDPLLMSIDDNGQDWDSYRNIGVLGHITEENLKTRTMLEMSRCVLREIRKSNINESEIEKELQALMDFSRLKPSVDDVFKMIKSDNLLLIDETKNTDRVQKMNVPGGRYYAVNDQNNAIPPYFKHNSKISQAIKAAKRILPDAVLLDGRLAAFNNLSTENVDLSERTLVENTIGFGGLNVWARKKSTKIDNVTEGHEKTLEAYVKSIKVLLGQESDISTKIEAIFAKETKEDGEGGKTTAVKNYVWSSVDTPNWRKFRELLALSLMELIGIKDKQVAINSIKKIADLKLESSEFKAKLNGKKDDDAGAVWDALFRAKGGPLDGLMSLVASSDEIKMADKDTFSPSSRQAPNISAGFFDSYTAEDEKTFHITELILSWDSVRHVVDEIINENTANPDYIKTLPITFSNPLILNAPLTTINDLKRLKDFIDKNNPKNPGTLLVNQDEPKTYPLFQFLSRATSRRRPARQLQATSSKRSRAELALDLDDMTGDDDRRSIVPVGDDDELRAIDNVYETDINAVRSNSTWMSLCHVNLLQRLKQIEESHDTLEKLFAKILASTPVNKKVLKSFIDKNIPFPFGFVTANPHMRYRMHLGIKMLAGSETGATLMGFSNFIVGDDPRYKMHYGNYTTYSKAIIYQPKNIYVAFDIFCGKCLGGAGSVPIKKNNGYNPGKKIFNGDTVFLLVPYEYMDVPNIMDVSGHFKYFEDSANLDQADDSKPHYPTAARYNALFQWRTIADVNKYRVDHLYHSQIYDPARQAINYNTVVCWDEERYFDISTRRFTVKHQNTGHFGPFCYPGCKALRNGAAKPWFEPSKNPGDGY
jgi:hypothetical protein